jgi:hypothetical protein
MGVLSKTGKERWISMRAENVLARSRTDARPTRGSLFWSANWAPFDRSHHHSFIVCS